MTAKQIAKIGNRAQLIAALKSAGWEISEDEKMAILPENTNSKNPGTPTNQSSRDWRALANRGALGERRFVGPADPRQCARILV